ncbi:uncharacterized protein LOC121420494 isoform X1 [Lytechinus variegatus]|uniref:uncharacterized protein LOC121420494 isoform X1 n=1 Tax=Lytechinus variegatus TaxID=7654 RepID=UPI001BB257D5|nr:uncharacterized protein LOC121420494 isoform X1 [Lytechinus variegatus]
MSEGKGEISEVDGSAPLDLRVKREVKSEPTTTPVTENVPLNLSRPVHPKTASSAPPEQPTPAAPPLQMLLQRGTGDVGVQGKPGSPEVQAAVVPPPLVKHSTSDSGSVSKTMLVKAPPKSTAPMHHQISVVPPPDTMAIGHVGGAPYKRSAPAFLQHGYLVPPHLTPHAIALETVVGSPKIPLVTSESNHASGNVKTTSPAIPSGPTKLAKTTHLTPPALSPTKSPKSITAPSASAGAPSPASARAPSPANSPAHEHYVKAPSPRPHPKKKTSPVPRESPSHVVQVTSESGPAKASPASSGRPEKHGPTLHGVHQSLPMSMDRLVAHGAPPRPHGTTGPHPGNSQKHPPGHSSPSGLHSQEVPSHPRPRLPQHRKKSPTTSTPASKSAVSQNPELTAGPRHVSGLPQHLPRQGPPLHVSPQQLPQRLPIGTPHHAVHAPPVEALLTLRHPITSGSSIPEGVSLYPPRVTRPPGINPGPHGPSPVVSPATNHPTQPRPSPPRPSPPRPSPPRTATAPHTSAQVSPSSPPTSSTSQPHPSTPSFRELPHRETIRHPGAAGQGYIPPPPSSSEYYPMRPRGPQPSSTTGPAHPSGVPPRIQTPSPMQAPGQRYPPSSAPFAVNPFVSLSIAIDCQRATEQDSDGDTALHIAIVQDKADMGLIRRLIELVQLAGKSVDIFNFMQQTPLHLACIMKDCDIIKLLMEAGANPNEADRNGQTAAHHACKNNTERCLGTLLKYTEVDVNLNIRNYEGYTPLHLAAMVGNPTLVTMLLEKGADINSKDSKNGWTPLFHAVTNQDTKLVHNLLSSGAEVNIQSYSGNTVLHVATGRGYTDIVKILVHYGADMSLKNTQWDTPATITTDKNMSSLLRGLGAGSPQPSEASSPTTAPPTLPMPLNDAYLIHPPQPGSASALAAAAAAAAAAASGQSKKPSTVTTLTTERLKGPANEVYEVTRSVTRGDGKISDEHRAIHKQLQEKLRQSIQIRQVNERRVGESHQRKSTEDMSPERHLGTKKIVIVPVSAGEREKLDQLSASHSGSKALSDSLGLRVSLPLQISKRSPTEGDEQKSQHVALPRTKDATEQADGSVKSKSTPDVVPKIEITSPEPVDKTKAQSTSDSNHKDVQKASDKDGKHVVSSSPSDRCTHQMVCFMNGHRGTIPKTVDDLKWVSKKITQGGEMEQVEPATSESTPKHTPMEAALISSALIAPDIAALTRKTKEVERVSPPPTKVTTAPAESENEVRARMLSLQYKNSDAILGNRYERKLDSVGSEQEHEVANTILTIHSRLQQQQEQERQQKQAQTCDADSTVKTEPVSPNPVLSSTTSDNPSARSQSGSPLSPPVLEREGDRPLAKNSSDNDDMEPNLIIDETLKSKSRKRTRTPTKSIPNLSPTKTSSTSPSPQLSTSSSTSSTSDFVGMPSNAGKSEKVKVTGDPKKLWTKKAMAMMGSLEPKRKRKKSEKSVKENY